jgi:BirA family transcriptional regulator, biotin operon repressor / biotin---[acetyl-CoA-carboxylase] ligase
LRSSRSDAALPPELDEALERARDRLGPLAIRVVYFTTIGSTNDVAASLAAAPESFGTVVIADTQTAGRGRRGRTWFSPAGSGLYVSVIVSPARAASDPDRATTLLTLAAGVALAEGVERATGLAPAIKWPNDLLVARRKLAGILAEAVGDAVVLGYGINVGPAAYPPELRDRATSLETELGRPIDRAVVAVETLAALASRYDDLVSGRFDAILDAWRRRSPTHRGARVVWDTPAGPQSGITDGIDALGALLVRVSDRVERIVAGEVRWI